MVEMEDIEIQTVPIRLVEKKTGLSGDTILGSVKLPPDKMGQITLREVMSSSPDTWFAICDQTGSISFIYLKAAGIDREVGTIKKPIETVTVGSIADYVRVRVLNATLTGS